MKYTPPKTRIKITKKVNGDVVYQPQYEMFFFCWEGMKDEDSWFKSTYDNIKEAQERIDLFLSRLEDQYAKDIGGKVDSVEYVKYP